MECRLIERSDPLEVVLITDFVDTVQNERLAAALRQLTDRQRRMIELAYWEGYPLKDIAVIMNCKPNTVSQLISRAKRHHTDQINDLKQDQHPQVLVLP